MKKAQLRILVVFLGIAFIVLAAVVLLSISRSDTSSVLDTRATLENYEPLPVAECISIEGDSIWLQRSKYVMYGDYYSLNGMQNDLAHLDSIGLHGEDLLYDALTQGLWEPYQGSFAGFYPDTLNMFVNWVERLDLFTEVNPENAMLYQPVIYYWMDKITGNLETNYKNDRSLKFNYKFRYVQDRCEQMKFGTVIGDKKVEKLMYNIMDKNWSYIWDRLAGSTTISEKLILLFLSMLTLYGYICIVKIHLKK